MIPTIRSRNGKTGKLQNLPFKFACALRQLFVEHNGSCLCKRSSDMGSLGECDRLPLQCERCKSENTASRLKTRESTTTYFCSWQLPFLSYRVPRIRETENSVLEKLLFELSDKLGTVNSDS